MDGGIMFQASWGCQQQHKSLKAEGTTTTNVSSKRKQKKNHQKLEFWVAAQITERRPIFFTDARLKPRKASKTIFMSDSQLIFPFNSTKPLFFPSSFSASPLLLFPHLRSTLMSYISVGKNTVAWLLDHKNQRSHQLWYLLSLYW